MSSNYFTTQFFEYFSKTIEDRNPNTNLNELILRDLQINEYCGQILIESVFFHSKIEKIDLRENLLSNKVGNFICNCIKNRITYIKEFKLHKNKICESILKEINNEIQKISNKALTSASSITKNNNYICRNQDSSKQDIFEVNTIEEEINEAKNFDNCIQLRTKNKKSTSLEYPGNLSPSDTNNKFREKKDIKYQDNLKNENNGNLIDNTKKELNNYSENEIKQINKISIDKKSLTVCELKLLLTQPIIQFFSFYNSLNVNSIKDANSLCSSKIIENSINSLNPFKEIFNKLVTLKRNKKEPISNLSFAFQEGDSLDEKKIIHQLIRGGIEN